MPWPRPRKGRPRFRSPWARAAFRRSPPRSRRDGTHAGGVLVQAARETSLKSFAKALFDHRESGKPKRACLVNHQSELVSRTLAEPVAEEELERAIEPDMGW